ncbi:hypothetical protein [Chondrinema litorale]|uniref:hypothetical protein n=1 Tax=Chondrinema litorale TaxID=2994555 RepID=UPI002542E0B1|nr:hypothetical protein [Chondrinema litorale]UZR95374.1 hypothetical protein OQ292_06020 [Chondrinema litorale]
MSKISFILGFVIAIIFTASGVKLDFNHISFEKSTVKQIQLNDNIDCDTVSYVKSYNKSQVSLFN